jgi:DNA-directed RNA polymerase specialized sigma24 family protein
MSNHSVPTPQPGSHEPGSVSVLLPCILHGDQEAIHDLWERFSPQLIAYARSRLGRGLNQPVEGEDVALAAFERFVELAGRPDATTQFYCLEDRDDLQRILFHFTKWEASRWLRRRPGPIAAEGLEQFVGREPEPDFDLCNREEIEHLLGKLHGRNAEQTERLRRLVQLKMEGLTNEEIARQLNCCEAQVGLLLRHIREQWKDHDPRPRGSQPPCED